MNRVMCAAVAAAFCLAAPLAAYQIATSAAAVAEPAVLIGVGLLFAGLCISPKGSEPKAALPPPDQFPRD